MNTHSATNDLFDYIGTLDPAEALGEILHQRVDPVCTEGTLHTCTLLYRAYAARATEGGAK